MPSLKDLKNRIASVKSTRKITKAMQMVAAAKLRRAQEAAEAARPYTERFNAVLAGLAAGDRGLALRAPAACRHGAGRRAPPRRHDLGAGACGRLQLLHRADGAGRGHRLLRAGKTVQILTVGKKGRDALRRDLSAQ
jgi:F-type H+-transporting ATPase subunit gamma